MCVHHSPCWQLSTWVVFSLIQSSVCLAVWFSFTSGFNRVLRPRQRQCGTRPVEVWSPVLRLFALLWSGVLAQPCFVFSDIRKFIAIFSYCARLLISHGKTLCPWRDSGLRVPVPSWELVMCPQDMFLTGTWCLSAPHCAVNLDNPVKVLPGYSTVVTTDFLSHVGALWGDRLGYTNSFLPKTSPEFSICWRFLEVSFFFMLIKNIEG